MSGDAAASTLVEIKLKQLEREGKKVDEKQKKELYESVRASYEHQTDPRYAAARLWVDASSIPPHARRINLGPRSSSSASRHPRLNAESGSGCCFEGPD